MSGAVRCAGRNSMEDQAENRDTFCFPQLTLKLLPLDLHLLLGSSLQRLHVLGGGGGRGNSTSYKAKQKGRNRCSQVQPQIQHLLKTCTAPNDRKHQEPSTTIRPLCECALLPFPLDISFSSGEQTGVFQIVRESSFPQHQPIWPTVRNEGYCLITSRQLRGFLQMT